MHLPGVPITEAVAILKTTSSQPPAARNPLIRPSTSSWGLAEAVRSKEGGKEKEG